MLAFYPVSPFISLCCDAPSPFFEFRQTNSTKLTSASIYNDKIQGCYRRRYVKTKLPLTADQEASLLRRDAHHHCNVHTAQTERNNIHGEVRNLVTMVTNHSWLPKILLRARIVRDLGFERVGVTRWIIFSSFQMSASWIYATSSCVVWMLNESGLCSAKNSERKFVIEI